MISLRLGYKAIALLLFLSLSAFALKQPLKAAHNINFSIDSDSLPPALQDIIKSIAGLRRIVVSGSFNGEDSSHWFFSGSLIVETVYGVAFNGDLSISYQNGVVDWSLRFGSGIKIKIWSMGTKRFDVAFKSIPFIKYIDVGADVYLEMGGVGGLTNGEGQADVYLGLSVEAVLGFFKDKAEGSDASVDAYVYGKLHLVISYDGKYIRAGWYPEIGARAVIRLGKWFSWNWGDVWIPEDIPWPLYEYDTTSRRAKISIMNNVEDIPGGVCNSTDGGGTSDLFVSDAPDEIGRAMDIGAIYDEVGGRRYVYPIYGSAMYGSQLKVGDRDFYRVYVGSSEDVIIYLKPEVADFDLYVYSPGGELYKKSIHAGDSLDVVVVPKSVLESWNGEIIIGVYHYYDDGVYVVNIGFPSTTNDTYIPPTEVTGTISSDGASGPHYSNPNSCAWREIKVLLEEDTAYRFILEWNNDSDLDLYLYRPGESPLEGGTGEDYVASSQTLDKPEIIEYIPDMDGIWVVGIDYYSLNGSTSFILKIEKESSSSGFESGQYTPPCTIEGQVTGVSLGPHFDDYESEAWAEFSVELRQGAKYRITLDWDSGDDLDLYIYRPGTSPLSDGDGGDFYNRSFTTSRPEIIEVTPDIGGAWIIAVDQYSIGGTTQFRLEILEIGGGVENYTGLYVELSGTVIGDGKYGPHYNDWESSAWNEHYISLSEGKTYRVILSWNSYADLDIYVYRPGEAPSQDSSGSDYFVRGYTTQNPEVLEFTPSVGGEWCIAVDRYSPSGSTSYKITVMEIGVNESSGVININGQVSGDGQIGPHYGGNTSAWSEHIIYLEEGEYRITLTWSGSLDLDLYLYRPGTSPEADGDGYDFYARSYTLNKPEVLEVSIDESGEWVIAVDCYSASGSSIYTLMVESLDRPNTRLISSWGGEVGNREKDISRAGWDLDRDGIPDYIEDNVIIFDSDNPLIPAIYPPVFVVVVSVYLAIRRRIFLKGKTNSK